MYNLFVLFHVSEDIKNEVTTATQNDEESSPSVHSVTHATQKRKWANKDFHNEYPDVKYERPRYSCGLKHSCIKTGTTWFC